MEKTNGHCAHDESVFEKWTNLFPILFRSTFRWTAYSVGIALSVRHVTLSLDTFLKIIGITRIIRHDFSGAP